MNILMMIPFIKGIMKSDIKKIADTKANLEHTHIIDDVSGLDTVLDSKMPITKITTATDLNTLTETGVYLINVHLSTENHAPKNDSMGVLVVYKRSNAGFGANASIVQVFYRFDGEYTIMGAPQFPQFGMDTQPTSGVFVYTRVSYLRDDWGNWLEFSFKGHMHTIDNITDSFKYVRMKSDERTKLSGIAENANNYVHPDTHPASMITGFSDAVKSCTDSTVTETGEMPVSGSAVHTLVSNMFSLVGDTLNICSPDYAAQAASI